MSPKPKVSLDFRFARKSTRTLIIRRGPTKVYRLILWNRKDDSFEDGQWLKGGFGAHEQALSPDGAHLIYCASNYSPRSDLSEWTAISRPPWFTAIALYPTVFFGGGRFLSDTYFELFAERELGDRIGHTGKLERVLSGEKTSDNKLGYVKYDGSRVPFSREDREYLLDENPGSDIMLGYHVEKGCLYRRDLHEDGTFREFELIRDFNNMKFEPLRAPYDTRSTSIGKSVGPWHPLGMGKS